MPAVKDGEKRLEVGKIVDQNKRAASHEHTAHTPQAEGMAQWQRQRLDIIGRRANKAIGITRRAGNIVMSETNPLRCSCRSCSEHDIGHIAGFQIAIIRFELATGHWSGQQLIEIVHGHSIDIDRSIAEQSRWLDHIDDVIEPFAIPNEWAAR